MRKAFVAFIKTFENVRKKFFLKVTKCINVKNILKYAPDAQY